MLFARHTAILRPVTVSTTTMKTDLFGRVERVRVADGGTVVVRDTRAARWWTRALARRLAAREARALERLAGIDGVPALLGWDGEVLTREWIAGQPMQVARPSDAGYFRAALGLLGRVHARRVSHNDLAKEPNWIVRSDGSPGLLDFQLATTHRHSSRWFRVRAREDLRHLLKHKRTYRPQTLTARQRAILATPAWPSRLWMRTVKPVYLWLTRRVLGWADREGAGDRQL